MSKYQKFLLFGDSITEFAYTTQPFSLGGALSAAYTRKLDILHRGYSGYTSRWGIKILEDILEEHEDNDIAIATIYFGANDSCLGGPQVVPLNEYIENMKLLIYMLRKHNIKPIFIGLALFNRELWETIKVEEIKLGHIRTVDNLQVYNNSLKQLAKTENVPFVDLHKAFTEIGGESWKDLLLDGLHFSSKGYEIWYNELLAAIKENYPEYYPDNMKTMYPLWRDVKADGSNI
ncbi:similar to Saccharomyces cerevisiae YOR126C IAH1 Isoamyl acetate-hydrolyzing esterase [Maudiozyma saulgeensis]|uniref:Similar to Saccharomyces cerevisiae YOR126C IAH1 Isoamyl acetate-hydrolyzing esterase n=1 Tax=Maudiozyma saulgeensis TaxID=1789683 RepID=A0A1X7QXQ3_9SACH|nr:similar to Saccharomyces cerevisiae YOR126C IAH1 Isoamyl acetate-hydrolyzing esterase [Kazachstania saulgeensis]